MVRSTEGALVPFDFAAVLDKIPELNELDLGITVVSFPELIDSSDMHPGLWDDLGCIIHENYDRYDGFVVLHGTDTMSYTASALSYMFSGLDKPIILTGAQIPIGHLRSDARDNLITALQIASAKEDGRPIIKEVALYFNFVLLRGNRSQKVRSSTFAAFESQNYPILASSGIFIEYFRSNLLQAQEGRVAFRQGFDPRVVLIKIFPGLSKEAFQSCLNMDGLKGVVLETFGSGNTMIQAWLFEALSQAIARGVVVYNISQCSGGEVIQGRYASSKNLEDIGVISGGDITSEAAITKLMFLLANCTSVDEIRTKLALPVTGEMDA